MAILKRDLTKKMEIDLTSTAGNAYALLGMVKRLGKELGFSEEKMSQIREDMMSGGFEDLIKVFDENFGDYVDLIR